MSSLVLQVHHPCRHGRGKRKKGCGLLLFLLPPFLPPFLPSFLPSARGEAKPLTSALEHSRDSRSSALHHVPLHWDCSSSKKHPVFTSAKRALVVEWTCLQTTEGWKKLGLFFLKSPSPEVRAECKPQLGNAEVRLRPVHRRVLAWGKVPHVGTRTCHHCACENTELLLLPHLWKGNPGTSNSLILRSGGYSTAGLGASCAQPGVQSPGTSGCCWGRQQAGGREGAASSNWCFWRLISLNPLRNRDQVTGLPIRSDC